MLERAGPRVPGDPVLGGRLRVVQVKAVELASAAVVVPPSAAELEAAVLLIVVVVVKVVRAEVAALVVQEGVADASSHES